MVWWVWVIVGLVFLASEVATPGGIVMLFFGAAALVVGTLKAVGLGGPVWLEWVLFSVLSVVSLLTLRGPILRRMKSQDGQPDDVDSLIGTSAHAISELAPGADGQAELRGTTWSARNIGTESLASGQECEVERVEGLKLFVRGTS
jgi:membrane protein implicated in regulation of membrane protease activity